MGTEPVPFGFELLSEFLIVVDFAIECEPDGLVLIRHGLSPGGREIDDAQPFVSQSDATGI
jgi:hypothetical protein